MRLLRLLAFPLAVCAFAGPAAACMEGGLSYFSARPPERRDGAPMLRVRITEIRGRTIDAELDGPVARLSPDGRVRIELPENDNCNDIGPAQGSVFVVGRLIQYSSGALTLRAMPSRPVRIPRVVPLPGRSRYDQYIVDPAYRSDAPAQTPPR